MLDRIQVVHVIQWHLTRVCSLGHKALVDANMHFTGVFCLAVASVFSSEWYNCVQLPIA